MTLMGVPKAIDPGRSPSRHSVGAQRRGISSPQTPTTLRTMDQGPGQDFRPLARLRRARRDSEKTPDFLSIAPLGKDRAPRAGGSALFCHSVGAQRRGISSPQAPTTLRTMDQGPDQDFRPLARLRRARRDSEKTPDFLSIAPLGKDRAPRAGGMKNIKRAAGRPRAPGAGPNRI